MAGIPCRSLSLRVPSLMACAALTSFSACGGETAATPQGGLAFSGRSSLQGSIDKDYSKYEKTVLATKPLAYFPFESASQGSLVGGYTTSLLYGAKIAQPGAIKSEGKADGYLSLSGTAYATTSLYGGIPGTGSMVAWVNLSVLPSINGATFYVSGESQDRNDFDIQFQSDNNLYFYTAAGAYTEYHTNPNKLVGRWNMIAATYLGNYSNGFRDIYWNGKHVVSFQGQVEDEYKYDQFNIGESLVFPGRYFQGGIDDVAVWGRALKGSEIQKIYAAAK